ncbi:MAG TPA: DUF6787 family protein [Candidatus Omnitrophota bacterium]|nr:DUF6787 family protein [Candidatus Omnitrophota bacterium]
MKMIQKLKNKWNITSNWDFVLIMLTFSLAGLGVSFSRREIFAVLGINHTSLGFQIFMSLLLIVPLYQLSTLFFGLFLGQFNFFWERQKAIGRALRKIPAPFKRI